MMIIFIFGLLKFDQDDICKRFINSFFNKVIITRVVIINNKIVNMFLLLNFSFEATFVMYINNTNNPPIITINNM